MGEKIRININGVDLVAVEGDITREDVDAVVNAANSMLAHGGGVAGAIAKVGGTTIISESREWVKRNGPVPVGNVAVTSGGNLPARYVIHAVGPRWGEGDEEQKLRNAVKNALTRAESLGCRSISMPAISTGIFGYPKEEGVSVIVDEAIKFTGVAKNIKEIRFVSIDRPTAELFAKELGKWKEI